MSPKRKDRAAPPPRPGGWGIRFGTTQAAQGWDGLCSQAADNLRAAWEELETSPGPVPRTERHHQLKGTEAFGEFDGRRLPKWQYEVTGGGRIWYLLDEERRTLWLMYAGTGHPKQTD